jgi:LPS export ABC transporter protein LptC
MITRNTRRGILALVLLTTVSFWVNRLQHTDAPEPVADLDPKLNYVLRDFELQFFDENGNPTINLQAPVFRNDPDKKLGTIEKPAMKLNQPEFVWDLTADAATVTADKEHVQLLGQVHVKRQELVTGSWVKVETREVKIEITPQTATTNEPVNVYDGQNQASAVGLELDLKSNTFYLKEQVKATYAVN